MTRTILSGLLAVISVVGIAVVPLACQSGGVGDPCTPEDEYDPGFSGFKITEDNVESRSFQCQTRICLVNHFQGRVSCPLGQQAPTSCNGPSGPDTSAATGCADCTEAGTLAPDCDPAAGAMAITAACAGFAGTCNKPGKFCECSATTPCPDGYTCDPNSKQCKSYVCHTKNNGQRAGGPNKRTQDCCIPGTDTPVSTEVCGQCASRSNRDAAGSVYCSCRCDVATGDAKDPNFNYCTCPSGYECSPIRPDLGPVISDTQLTGKYCIKSGSAYPNDLGASCGQVAGKHGLDDRLVQRHPRSLIRTSPRKSTSAASERRRELGKRAELAVSDYVTARGCTILHSNLRVGRLEIDLVARDGPVVAVIEVRTRGASSWQRALDSVGPKKRARLRTAGDRLWRDLLRRTPRSSGCASTSPRWRSKRTAKWSSST